MGLCTRFGFSYYLVNDFSRYTAAACCAHALYDVLANTSLGRH